MLLLNMVRYQALLCFGHTRYGHYCYKQAMQVKLQVFYHVLSSRAIRAFLNMAFTFIETLVY